MESGIQLLEIASGLKESLLRVGFTVDSSSEGSDPVSAALGIEPYVAKIIYNEAKKKLRLKAPWLLPDFSLSCVLFRFV
jgi:hypothetical protein